MAKKEACETVQGDPWEGIPEPQEPRGHVTGRLRRAGKWTEASLYREKRRLYWGKQGFRQDAKDLAWAEMIAEFPPEPEPEPKPEPMETQREEPPDPLDIREESQELVDRLAQVPSDWDRDVTWCHEVYAHPAVRLASAPSLAAWGLLAFARSDPPRFYAMVERVAARLAKPKPTDTTADETNDDGDDPGLADLERMIRASG